MRPVRTEVATVRGPCRRGSLVLALFSLACGFLDTHGDSGGQPRRNHPDDVAVALRFRAPHLVAGCSTELDVTVVPLAQGHPRTPAGVPRRSAMGRAVARCRPMAARVRERWGETLAGSLPGTVRGGRCPREAVEAASWRAEFLATIAPALGVGRRRQRTRRDCARGVCQKMRLARWPGKGSQSGAGVRARGAGPSARALGPVGGPLPRGWARGVRRVGQESVGLCDDAGLHICLGDRPPHAVQASMTTSQIPGRPAACGP